MPGASARRSAQLRLLPGASALAPPHGARDEALDFILESVPAEDEARPPGSPDLGDVPLRDRIAEQLAVGAPPFFRGRAEPGVQRVLADHGARDAAGVVAVARPGKISRLRHDAEAHRIELDIAMAGQQVAFAVED